MGKDMFIKMDGASVNVAHVLSFSSEKEFVETYDSKLYKSRDQKVRKAQLKSLFKLAKKQSDELSKTNEREDNQ